MTRKITHEARGPDFFDDADVEAHGGDIAIRRCGLSAGRPFCDGSHQTTEAEAEGVRYTYETDDAENPRHELEEILFVDD